jgi:hypothetical protein
VVNTTKASHQHHYHHRNTITPTPSPSQQHYYKKTNNTVTATPSQKHNYRNIITVTAKAGGSRRDTITSASPSSQQQHNTPVSK